MHPCARLSCTANRMSRWNVFRKLFRKSCSEIRQTEGILPRSRRTGKARQWSATTLKQLCFETILPIESISFLVLCNFATIKRMLYNITNNETKINRKWFQDTNERTNNDYSTKTETETEIWIASNYARSRSQVILDNWRNMF